MNEVVITNNGVTIPTAVELAKVSYLDIRRDCRKYPRVGQVKPDTAVLTLKGTILKMLALTGRQGEDMQVEFMAGALYEALMADEDGCGTMHLSFAEIEKALRKAVFGRAGEMYGINVASLYKAITDYAIGEGHAASEMLRKEKEQARLVQFKKSSIGIAIDSKSVAVAKKLRK